MKNIIIILFAITIICIMNKKNLTAQQNITELLPYKKGEKFVYVNNNNEIVINKSFDFAYPFEGELAKVIIKNKYGVINKVGKWVIKPKYDKVTIIGKGVTQVIEAAKGYNAWYRIGNWQLMPNFNILSTKYRGPFLETRVPFENWVIFDNKGRELASKHQKGTYRYYNNIDVHRIENYNPFNIESTNNKLYLY